MKVQMKFQKILVLCSLIISALCIVSALVFPSGNLANIQYYRSQSVVTDFNETVQSFVQMMLVVTIIYLCMIILMYLTDTNKRRNYYITNYISSGLAIAGACAVAIIGIIYTSIVLSSFYGLDWDAVLALVERYASRGGPEVSKAPTMFIISYITSLLALVDAVAIALNLVLKIKLMKGEKALLNQGKAEEVA